MSTVSYDYDAWWAAMAAWNGLDAARQARVIGYVASADAGLVTRAIERAAGGDDPPLGEIADAGMGVRDLTAEQLLDVALLLCDRIPAITVQAIADAGYRQVLEARRG